MLTFSLSNGLSDYEELLTAKESSAGKKPSAEKKSSANEESSVKEEVSVEVEQGRVFLQPGEPDSKRRRVEEPSTSGSSTAREALTGSHSNRVSSITEVESEPNMPKTVEQLFEWEFQRNAKFLIDNAPTSTSNYLSSLLSYLYHIVPSVASLLSDFFKLKRENEKLQTQVIKLREKEAFYREFNECIAKSIGEIEGSSHHSQPASGKYLSHIKGSS